MTAPGLLGTALLGAAVSAILTPLAASAARRLGILDRPQGYKAHARPTPLLGGLAVTFATALALGAAALGTAMDRPALLALLAGTAVIGVAGLLDDLRGLNPAHKITWQLIATAAAALALAGLGVRVELFLDGRALAAGALTVLWVVTVANALNLFDNMNGLCAGTGAVAAAFIATCNAGTGAATAAYAAAALAGACAGFLPYNWPRARIFLGDTGSMAIGFGLAAISVMGIYTPRAPVPGLAVLAPVLILALPLADMLLVVLLRLEAGHPPWRGDRRHVSHRLVRRGLPPWAAVAALWLGGGACGAAAVLLTRAGGASTVWMMGGVLALLAVLFLAAGRRGLD